MAVTRVGLYMPSGARPGAVDRGRWQAGVRWKPVPPG